VEDGKVVRVNLSEWNNYQDFDTRQPATAPRDGESHSATDVGIFATGQLILILLFSLKDLLIKAWSFMKNMFQLFKINTYDLFSQNFICYALVLFIISFSQI
jgi:hypothetical protein